MPVRRRLNLWVTTACALLIGAPRASVAASDGEFMLIDRHLETTNIEVAELSTERLVYVARRSTGAAGVPVTEPGLRELEKCVALVRWPLPAHAPSPGAEVVLADGQRLPGEAVSGAPAAEDVLVWNHAQLGRMQIPIDRIASVTFQAGAEHPVAADADVVVLANGDRLRGFVLAIGDPIELETEFEGEAQRITVPLDRAVAVAIVAPPKPAAGQRVWLRDGSVIDVRNVLISDDGFARLVDANLAGSSQVDRVAVSQVSAVLFDARALTPLASLKPRSVEGPVTRYRTPVPAVGLGGSGARPLGLADVRLSGPVIVRYAMPHGARRFAARASLPPGARTWGDCEIVIRNEGAELTRATLSGASPEAEINVPVRGAELTIEVTEGAGGPIQDEVVLSRAMIVAE